MNALSVKLLNCKLDAILKKKTINLLMYADDLIIFSPTIEGLKLLLHKCEEYDKSHFIKFSPLKECHYDIKIRIIKDAKDIHR